MNNRPAASVVLKRDEMQEQKTIGGIVIPDSAKEKPQECKVVTVGPGKLDDSGLQCWGDDHYE